MRTLAMALLLATVSGPLAAATPAPIAAAVSKPGRPADAVKLDASRKPAEILAFMGLKPGMSALDVMTGGGYYAELMGRVVGTKGRVVAYEHDGFVDDKGRAMLDALKARQPNVTPLVEPVAALSLTPKSFDFAMIHLNYHDLYWTSDQYHFPRIEPDTVLKTLFAAMKPGGIVAVVDHVGAAGDTRAIVDKVHRIDPETVKADFARAGFVLDGSSDLLRMPADDHSLGVFNAAIRGKTDRFAFRFRKPG